MISFHRFVAAASVATLACLTAGWASAEGSASLCVQQARQAAAMAIQAGASPEEAELTAAKVQAACVETGAKIARKALEARPMPRPGRKPAAQYSCKVRVF